MQWQRAGAVPALTAPALLRVDLPPALPVSGLHVKGLAAPWADAGLSQQQGWNSGEKEGAGAACGMLDRREERPGTATWSLGPQQGGAVEARLVPCEVGRN